MTEILTESFCERCGTRYTFESAAPRQKRLGGLKVLGRGLRNFVMSDDSSLDEAFAAARSDAERDATAQQLDAFHKTFNFCMSCRQYTCSNCWNEAEARCLSCAPLALPEPTRPESIEPDRLLRFLGSAPAGAVGNGHPSEMIGAERQEAELIASTAAAGHGVAADAAAPMPVVDTGAEPAASELAPDRREPVEARGDEERPTVVPPSVDATHAELLALTGAAPPANAEFDAWPEPSSDAAPDDASRPSPAPVEPAAAPIHPAIGGMAPGQSLDDALAAYEAEGPADGPVEAPAAASASDDVGAPVETGAETAPVPADEPGVTADLLAERLAALGLSPGLPGAQPRATEAAASAETGTAVTGEAAATTAPAVPARDDVVDQPVWRPVPPAAAPGGVEPAGGPTSGPAMPSFPEPPVPAGPPTWPTGPRWPTSLPARQAPPPPAPAADPLAALIARKSTEAMWAASSQELLHPAAAVAPSAAVKPCASCGISLSATARFCRRCGSAQG